ncbi:MAG: nicotinate-nucleotide--dimethylbenzimidazole phosphoribosyltransferase, partial [Actinobacteria bacterium]|nr:nicotinate-nucleotide--dimethylbenzimidazole phosphoribosyltransferase [Actinomycetota bacterium]
MADLTWIAEPMVPIDQDAQTSARRSAARAVAGAAGPQLDWISGAQGRWPPAEPARPRLIVFVGDHGIGSAAVSRLSAADTQRTVDEIASGAAPLTTLAELHGVGLRVLPVGLDAVGRRRPSEPIDRMDALSEQQVVEA